MEPLLKDKIQLMAEYLISQCNDTNKVKQINDTLTDLPLYKIILFINFLDLKKMDAQIDDFIKLFSLNDTEDSRNKIKEYLNYFIEVKSILNN